jgi:hypothetical protein
VARATNAVDALTPRANCTGGAEQDVRRTMQVTV